MTFKRTSVRKFINVAGREFQLGQWASITETTFADMLHRRRLRSASTDLLDGPTCRLSTVGDRAFPVAGAKVYSVERPAKRCDISFVAGSVQEQLKTYLFHRCYETV